MFSKYVKKKFSSVFYGFKIELLLYNHQRNLEKVDDILLDGIDKLVSDSKNAKIVVLSKELKEKMYKKAFDKILDVDIKD